MNLACMLEFAGPCPTLSTWGPSSQNHHTRLPERLESTKEKMTHSSWKSLLRGGGIRVGFWRIKNSSCEEEQVTGRDLSTESLALLFDRWHGVWLCWSEFLHLYDGSYNTYPSNPRWIAMKIKKKIPQTTTNKNKKILLESIKCLKNAFLTSDLSSCMSQHN